MADYVARRQADDEGVVASGVGGSGCGIAGDSWVQRAAHASAESVNTGGYSPAVRCDREARVADSGTGDERFVSGHLCRHESSRNRSIFLAHRRDDSTIASFGSRRSADGQRPAANSVLHPARAGRHLPLAVMTRSHEWRPSDPGRLPRLARCERCSVRRRASPRVQRLDDAVQLHDWRR